jgi:MSHA biogenesis protein MshI
MNAVNAHAVTWLDRLRTLRLGGGSMCTGLQWLGNEVAIATVRGGSDGDARIVRIAVLPAPAERRVEVVRQLVRAGVLGSAPIVVLLAPGQYDLQQMPLPAVPDDEMRDALRWQLRSHLAYPPEEALLDFIRLPHGGEHKQLLLAVAAHRPVVEAALLPLLQNALTVTAVDVPEFAQRNLAGFKGAAGVTSAWLGFERDTCLLTVHLDSELAFSRRMLMPGAAANEIEPETAESAQHIAERVVLQVQRSLDLFERQSGLAPLARAMLGPHRHAALIAALLADRCALRVETFDLEQRFQLPGADHATQLPPAALGALGAALRADEPRTAASLRARLRAQLWAQPPASIRKAA